MINKLKLSADTLQFWNAELDKLVIADRLAGEDRLSDAETEALPSKARVLFGKIENEIQISNKLLKND